MGLKAAGIMFVLLLLAGGGFVWYYNDTQERLAILQENNANQIDMSRFEAGMYNLILTYNNLQFTKKIIKQ